MKPDLVIVGGGIIGLYSAYLLTQRGINITLIDRSDFGQESSWAAGGILTPLLPWNYNKEVLSLTATSSEDYYNLSKHLFPLTNIDIEYWKCGLTVLDNCNDTIKRWCNSHKLAYQRISSLHKTHFHLPDIAQVRMPNVIKALIKYLQQNNVTLINNTSVHSCQFAGQQVTTINTSIGDIQTNSVLWASGAWLPRLANSTNFIRTPLITPIQGQIIAIQTVPGLLNHIIYKDGHYLIPRKDGLIIAGSTLEDVGYNKHITDSARNILWQNSLSMLPELNDYEITHQWAGLRPGSPANIPTIGPHPDIKGLYLNCGHFRYGVAMAPKSAYIISGWILDNGDSLSTQDRSYASSNFT